ncbi:MAG: hypothetical protein PHS97_03135 [Oscillospiraceae bacterium]|nr:hypothetical protein [Oscillospiraceae bacterium]
MQSNIQPDYSGKRAITARSKRQIIVLAVLLAAVIVAGVAAIVRRAPAQAPGSDTVVATCADRQITNRAFAYYFWTEYFYILNNASNVPEGLSNLSSQRYDETRTWQDYVMEQASDTLSQTLALVARAQQEGFSLPQSRQQELDALPETLAENAAQYGFTDEAGNADVDGYLAESFGAGATQATFLQYMTDAYLAAAYSDALFYSAAFSEAEVEAYYDSFAADYESDGVEKTDTYLASVYDLCLTVTGSEEAAYAAAEQEAARLLQSWDGSAEGFAALENDAALQAAFARYPDLHAGQLDAALDAWIFDAARAPGDTAVLRAADGVHLLYFVGGSDHPQWYERALSDLRYENYISALREMVEGSGFTFDSNQLALYQPGNFTIENQGAKP